MTLTQLQSREEYTSLVQKCNRIADQAAARRLVYERIRDGYLERRYSFYGEETDACGVIVAMPLNGDFARRRVTLLSPSRAGSTRRIATSS